MSHHPTSRPSPGTGSSSWQSSTLCCWVRPGPSRMKFWLKSRCLLPSNFTVPDLPGQWPGKAGTGADRLRAGLQGGLGMQRQHLKLTQGLLPGDSVTVPHQGGCAHVQAGQQPPPCPWCCSTRSPNSSAARHAGPHRS